MTANFIKLRFISKSQSRLIKSRSRLTKLRSQPTKSRICL